jgi:hypothetical protein
MAHLILFDIVSLQMNPPYIAQRGKETASYARTSTSSPPIPSFTYQLNNYNTLEKFYAHLPSFEDEVQEETIDANEKAAHLAATTKKQSSSNARETTSSRKRNSNYVRKS